MLVRPVAVVVVERIAVRIPVGDEQQIGRDLDRVTQPVGDQVAESARHPPTEEGGEPAKEGGRPDDPNADPVVPKPAIDAGRAERRAQEQRRYGEEQPEERLPPVLWRGPRDLGVHGIAPRLALEPRPRVRREVEVGVDVREVAQVPGLHVMADRIAGEQNREPVDEGNRRGEETEDPQHDQVRDHQDEAEEDGPARPMEIVADYYPGSITGRPRTRWRGRFRRRRWCGRLRRRLGRRLTLGRRDWLLLPSHSCATYLPRPMPFCQAASAVATSTAATARQGSASPAAEAVAPPPMLPSTCPAAQAMLIRPAARPWCSPLASAASLSIASAGAKQRPAPTERAISSPSTTPRLFGMGRTARAAAQKTMPATYGRDRPMRSDTRPTQAESTASKAAPAMNPPATTPAPPPRLWIRSGISTAITPNSIEGAITNAVARSTAGRLIASAVWRASSRCPCAGSGRRIASTASTVATTRTDEKTGFVPTA